MLAFVARRVFAAIPLILGVATLIFFLIDLAPGDPITLLSGPNVSAEVIETIREQYGLDEPVHVRYGLWMSKTLRGDWGHSYVNGREVRELVLDILPNTLLLSVCALGLAFLIGIVFGVVQAVKQYSALDSGLSVGALFFYSMPSFWLGLMLILVFGVQARNAWGWPISFPPSGMTSPDAAFLGPWDQLKDRVMHLALPTLSLALVLAAGIARYMRASMLEVIRQDYVRTARAKGLSEPVVVFKHALRNALLPVATLIGLYLPFLFSGTVFVEAVFAWPGMGRLIVESIFNRDYPVVMAGGFIFATIVVFGNLLADVLYGVIDPRIRYD